MKLQSAVARGDQNAVQQFLAAGTDPDGLKSFPLLHRAVSKAQFEIARLLIDAGADLERPNHAGWTALTRADADNRLDFVDLFLASGADPNARFRHGFTALHRAARSADPELCRELLLGGADVDARSADGSTALLIASELCDGEASRSLTTSSSATEPTPTSQTKTTGIRCARPHMKTPRM